MLPSTIQTIFLLYSGLSLAAAILIGALFWKKNDLSAKLWIYGCLLTSIATSVTVFRAEIPLVISYSLMVSLETLSIFIFSESLGRLSPTQPNRRMSWLTPTAPLILFLLVELLRHEAQGQVTSEISALSTFMFGIANIFCVYQARKTAKEFSNRIFFNFLAIVFALASFLYFMRVINVFSGYSGFTFDLKTYNLVIWFTLSLLNSIRNLTYIVLRLHLGFSEHSRLNNMNLRLSNALDERNEMIMSLQKLNRHASVNALASTISHEINQPLAATRLNAQFAEMKLQSDPSDTVILKEIIKNILDDINRASNIVKNLSRLASNKRNYSSKVSLLESINEVIEISKSKLRASNIDLELNSATDYQIQINMSEWQQVLINLLNNAVEALDESSIERKKITISITRELDSIKISIQDNGHGIKDGQESKIFELLVSNKEAGSGIGLWLSKNIMNRFGGDIMAKNSPSGGACFTITVPAA